MPDLNLDRLKAVSEEAWQVYIARQNFLDFINYNIFPATIVPPPVDEYRKKRDQLQAILTNRAMVHIKAIAADLLRLAEENEALETAIAEEEKDTDMAYKQGKSDGYQMGYDDGAAALPRSN